MEEFQIFSVSSFFNVYAVNSQVYVRVQRGTNLEFPSENSYLFERPTSQDDRLPLHRHAAS